MALAIFAGIVAGVLGTLPLYFGLRRARTMDAQTQALAYLTPMLLSLCGSMAVLFVCTVLCVVLARDVAAPFVISEGGALIVAAVCFGIARVVRK